jgi:hypothetical protein
VGGTENEEHGQKSYTTASFLGFLSSTILLPSSCPELRHISLTAKESV